ncbi:MAG: hypothetical protein HUU23_08845 [Caldilineales bacterium]|nr:hypothetical protein [Caldilineales bacterium]
MTTRERLGDIIWPVLLISAGALLLLANLNLVDANLWQTILNLWPLLIVAAALNLFLVGGSIFLPLTLLGFALAFLADNFALVDWQVWSTVGRLWPLILVALGLDVLITARLFGSAVREEAFSQPLEDASALEIKVEPGIGRFALKAGTADSLYSGLAWLGKGERIDQRLTRRQGQARVRLQQGGPWFFPFSSAWTGERRWEVQLNPALPTSLKVDGGLGPRQIDLRGLHLTRFKIDGGLGAARITLPDRGRCEGKVDGGIGDVTLALPAGMPARIRVDGGLGGRQVRGDFSFDGRAYLTPGFETAADRLDLKVDQGIGSLTLLALAE